MKYETVRNRSLFRLVSIVSQTEKNTKIRKKCFELFLETAKQCFVSYFRKFSFKFVPFSSFAPFIPVVSQHPPTTKSPSPPTTHSPQTPITHTHHRHSPQTLTTHSPTPRAATRCLSLHAPSQPGQLFSNPVTLTQLCSIHSAFLVSPPAPPHQPLSSSSNLLLIFPRRARWRGEEGIVGGDRLDHATNFFCFENPPPGGEGSYCFSSESAFERKAERCLIN